ncbi:MAG: radical SAM family heme chaperone HemW [Clostridiales bacterium]|nr:radical SAM family heme chaperone HemW [Clostridiales bacterium]
MSKEIGLYIHIPFCRQKCAYCDFASFAGQESKMADYVKCLIREIRQKNRKDVRIATLYIGGGTPSLLPPSLMEQILRAAREYFDFLPDAECSCECNPGTLTEAFLAVLRDGGVNRLSLGAQASQPHLLSLLGRIHTWGQVEDSVQLARQYGFHNLNLDLMLGLPTQTLAHVEETLQRALALSPTHLSCYGLIVEEGTRMQMMVDSGKWALPDEDTERAMYECCRKTLADHGLIQYEISNFAKPGFACRHNLDCWKRKEYIGVGSSACGFLEDVRYQNPLLLEDYLAGKPAEETFISSQDARFESVMLGLRMTEGIKEADFFAMHGVTLENVYGEKLKKPLQEGLLCRENGFLRLTRRGMDVQNRILVELL